MHYTFLCIKINEEINGEPDLPIEDKANWKTSNTLYSLSIKCLIHPYIIDESQNAYKSLFFKLQFILQIILSNKQLYCCLRMLVKRSKPRKLQKALKLNTLLSRRATLSQEVKQSIIKMIYTKLQLLECGTYRPHDTQVIFNKPILL